MPSLCRIRTDVVAVRAAILERVLENREMPLSSSIRTDKLFPRATIGAQPL
jgi:hypothetical protein